MERYTDLERAINDPSLVIITEDISTQKELNKAYVRYKALSKKQKRLSNYYSDEFLGHSVPEMYVLVKDRLRVESYIYEELLLPNEKYVVSEPDLYYREDSFN